MSRQALGQVRPDYEPAAARPRQPIEDALDGHGRRQSNFVHALQDSLDQEFAKDRAPLIDASSPAAACLQPLLTALKWIGGARHLAEALPHFSSIDTINDLRTVLANLGFSTTPHAMRLTDINEEILPCLFECEDGRLLVAVARQNDDQLYIFDGKTSRFRCISLRAISGTAYTIKPLQQADRSEPQQRNWTVNLLAKFNRTIAILFVLTMVINILAIALPIYIMTVYEQAIGTKSALTLISLFAGVSLVVCIEYCFRKVRSQALTYLGTRIEHLIALRTFQQLIYMPISLMETASIGSQITRLKQFESLRDMFSGNVANALLDLPFLVIFLVAAFVLGGPLGFIPLGLVAAYVVMGMISLPLLQSALRRNSRARSLWKNFLLELTLKQRAVSDCHAGAVWAQRHRDLRREFFRSQLKLQKLNAVIQALSQSFVTVAGAGAVGYGAYLAIGNELSMGALIAVTAIIWRCLAPLQVCFLGLNQVGNAITSFKQLNALLRLPQERAPASLPTLGRSFSGKVGAADVSLRYSDSSEPALRSVSLGAGEGEFIAVTGSSGAGKSTLLKILAGLQEPQAGTVMIDDLDIRQFDSGELRQAIGYVPQKLSLFYGTISQNLRLAHPSSTPEDVERALDMVGALDEARALPEGIETRLHGLSEQRFSSGFLKQIAIARAFIKQAPLYILDEPSSDLDRDADEQFVELLKRTKRKATIVLASHRPSHLRLADRVIVLRQGRILASGPPDKIMPIVLGERDA